ncbi:MAG: RNase adapter RapZ [Gammaproteobacteria bacterium]|nr:RNase adapter RapZ [Gammaproteobacteria bacterium]
MQLTIVSGLSGAGKTVALRQFEDLGWFCIDNLLPDLLQPLIGHALAHPSPRFACIALGVDARANAREIEDFPLFVDALKNRGVEVRVLFLTAENDVILRRYAETRRRHPLVGPEVTLAEAIGQERRLLKPIADLADDVLDTSHTNLHQLREAIQARIETSPQRGLALTLLSFGFKNGVPEGVDFVFDARCLPNPHWEPALRALSGRDAAVAAYLDAYPEARDYAADLEQLLRRWLPVFANRDRTWLTVAIGCTGGRHRSVYLVERLGVALRDEVGSLSVKHRDLGGAAP